MTSAGMAASFAVIIASAWLLLARKHAAAALVVTVIAVVPVLVGIALLRNWRGVATAWSDGLFAAGGDTDRLGRFAGPIRTSQYTVTRVWGGVFLFIGLFAEIEGLIYVVRDLT
jgi:hypothetical protein